MLFHLRTSHWKVADISAARRTEELRGFGGWGPGFVEALARTLGFRVYGLGLSRV